MKLDSKKELVPIHFSDYGAKIIYHFRFRPNVMAFSLHWHDRLELLRVWEGSLFLTCGSQNLQLTPGDIGIISSKMLHSGIAGPNGVVYDVVMIDFTFFLNNTKPSATYLQPLCDGSCQFEPLIHSPQLLERVDAIVEAHRVPNSRQPLQILGDFYDLAGLLYQNCVIREVSAFQSPKEMNDVIDYINEHYTEPISSALLSERFGHVESYFCRKFKKHTGLTVMQYIQILRMEKARKLLAETELSVQDIAAGCGFTDTAYFNNRFKKLYRLTPTEMRQRSQSNAYGFAEHKGRQPQLKNT